MKTYTLIAPAKINLYLEIVGDRPDGFHELVMLMQSVELADRVAIAQTGLPSLRVRCDLLPEVEEVQNLAYKAAQLMQRQFPEAAERWGGVDIEIDKQIPVAAGLAGGSADAAAVLVGLDLLWELGLTQPELQVLAAQLGSDIPFSLAGGTAIATGRGEQLDSLRTPTALWVVLAKYRHLSVSTAWAYTTYREQFAADYARDPATVQARAEQMHASELVAALQAGDGAAIARHLYNDLEKVVLPAYPPVAQLHATLQASSALGALMSGSGPTVFALCNSQAQAEQVQHELRTPLPDPDLDSWIAPFASRGVQLATE